MLIARQKRNENIAEWILYMWQVQDIIRAKNFDVQKIQTDIIGRVNDPELRDEYTAWYADIIKQMKDGEVTESGNINAINDVLMELMYLHNTLLNQLKDNKYRQLFEKAVPNLDEYAKKANAATLNQPELALQGLYSKLLLKLAGKEISSETEEAFKTFSNMLAYLAKQYRQMFSLN